MNSPPDAGRAPHSPTEQTGRARIMDAALRLFGERGVASTTIRDIAAVANVSPANVLHHFGSKDALRSAVDSHVGSFFQRIIDGDPAGLEALAARGDNPARSLAELFAAELPPDSPLPAYLRRLILDHDPVGSEIVARWVRLTATMMAAMEADGAVHPSPDPDARAAFLVANDLAMLLLREQLTTALGIDPLSPDGVRRWTATALDAYTTGIYRKEPS